MLAESLLEGLNPEQQEAVQTTEGPLLVLAGAGSGKTRVLTNRVAWLIGVCGIAPEAILAVTFTNKAAGEMRDRVEKLLGPDARGVWLSTFHSSCVRILRREIGHLGRSRGFVIYDEDDSLSVVREALRRHGQDPKEEARRLRWRIDQWKNAGMLPAAAAERAEDLESEAVGRGLRHLPAPAGRGQRARLRRPAAAHGRAVRALSRRCSRHYQERWQYVLVDEYQDTNRVQYRLVNQLAAAHRNLCVVGDRRPVDLPAGAAPTCSNILDFERDYPGREGGGAAPQLPLHAAHPVGRGRGGREQPGPPAEAHGHRPRRGRPHHRATPPATTATRRSSWCAASSSTVRERGHSFGQCAVFYRTNAQSRPIEEELLKYDVPYVVVGGVRFYERAEVKDALSYLRLLVNPADAAATAPHREPARARHRQDHARARGGDRGGAGHLAVRGAARLRERRTRAARAPRCAASSR